MNPIPGTHFEFGSPWLLLLLLLIPLVSWLRGKSGRKAAIQYSSVSLIKQFSRTSRSRAGHWSSALRYFALVLLIFALARPRAASSSSEVTASGIDILLAVDISSSMLSEDFTLDGNRVNRLEVVKKAVRDFISKRPSDRIGMIAFAGRPYLVSPLTLDHQWLLSNLERVEIGMIEDGTAIGTAVAVASSRLNDTRAKSKILILLTDGQNTAGKISPTTAAEAAKAVGVKIYTVGAGTEGTAPMPVRNIFGQIQYQNVPVNIDEETLTKVAEITEGKYFRATDTKSLEDIYDRIDKLEKTTITLKKYSSYRELFSWLAIPALGLILLEFSLGNTLWRRLP